MSQSQWLTKSGGKMVEMAKPKLKISVPRFDNTELIVSICKYGDREMHEPIKARDEEPFVHVTKILECGGSGVWF